MAGLENVMEQQLLQATAIMEQQVDAEIERLENMDRDELEILRERRMEAMKKAQEQKKEWLALGHGQYEEVPDEKEFFNACKKSKRVVCHFYRDSTERCKIVDKHLSELCKSHVETRFIKINAEKSPFLVQRLNIVVLPTICLAKDGKTVDYVVGFDDLGGKDDFPTDLLEWRIARQGVINYSGDLTTPPGGDAAASNSKMKKQQILGGHKKTIRGGGGDDSSDDNDW